MPKKKSLTGSIIDGLLKQAVPALELVNLISSAAKVALMLDLSREQFVDGIAGLARAAYDAEQHKRDKPGVPLVPTSTDGGST